MSSIEILKERNARMHSPSSVAIGRSFGVRESDVFVVTYPKCGTTWATAIVHALRTGGAPEFQDFEEITAVAPWDIVAADCGQDLEADQVVSPRLFKSHEAWADIAKGGRYVYACRNPSDAFVSFYNFLPAYMHCEGIGVETFAEAIFGGLSHSGGIWSHFVGWVEAARANPDRVLLVAFEDLKNDLRAEIRRIALFLGIPDNGLVDRVHDLSSYAYMSQHQRQFDDGFVFRRLKKQIGLPEDAEHKASKVRKGAVGGRKDLPPAVLEMLDTRWRNTVLPALGTPTYDDFLRDVVHGIPPN
ncbi:hypothetical protein CTAYLR_004680 [Chrysophaeum taylorii]|uniref:Sulfotransferase domain-containing protein n=1 Tax=Chrysophaeum taylorii TaxID=2483200 RepID=A0AAD7XIN4_9STRA|nr:hypothetical protein CTAYLR_004680 [Chrysophaeum taylorii]